jgi:hypothetical protein
MKKLFLAATLLVALTTSAFAGSNNVLFNNLKNAVKNATHITWTAAGQYKKAAFDFNGKTATAFYDAENDELIGFTIRVGIEELPAGAVENIQKKFNGWSITDRLLFTDANGNPGYYVQVSKDGHNLALSVNAKGKAHIFAQVP